MRTDRAHARYNTAIYGLACRCRGISGVRRGVFVHPADRAGLGIDDGATVDIVGSADGTDRRAPRFRVVAYPLARHSCAAYFPETNVLVPLDSVAEGSQTPTSKSVVVRLAAPPPAATA